jgi:hypothetical protein
MVAVRIVKPPGIRESASQVPRHQWRALAEERQHFCTSTVPDDCRLLLEFMQDGEQNEWLGFDSRERYIREGLGLDPDMVEWALVGLERTKPEEAAPFRSMVELGKRGAPKGNKNAAKVQDEEAIPISDLGQNKPSNRSIVFGTGFAYTLARLKRDRPDLAAQVETGKLSANAAAITAGFRKQATPLDQLRKAWKKATAAERETFLREVAH